MTAAVAAVRAAIPAIVAGKSSFQASDNQVGRQQCLRCWLQVLLLGKWECVSPVLFPGICMLLWLTLLGHCCFNEVTQHLQL